MKLFRLLLGSILLLAVGIVGAITLQAQRAMQQESLLFHQVIAEDIFDNIETQLALFMRDEDNRPFTHYSFYYVPENQVEGSVALYRSPLAELPKKSPIIAYFQINPLNQVEFPHLQNKPVQNKQEQWQVQDPVLSGASQYACAAVNNAIAEFDLLDDENAVAKLVEDNIGFVSQNGLVQNMSIDAQAAFSSRGNRSSFARDYNKTSQSKVSQSAIYTLNNSSSNIIQEQLSGYNDPQGDTVIDPELVQGEIRRANEIQSRQELVAQGVQEAQSEANGYAGQTRQTGNAQDADISESDLDVQLGRFQSLAVNEHQTLFYRHVSVAVGNFKQGFLIDTDALHAFLEQHLVKELPDASWKLHWLSGNHAEKALAIKLQEDHFGFYHPLEAPFQNSAVFIDMPPKIVALGMSERTLIMVAGSMLLVMAIGLLLTDRILVVKQRFAERRQNFVAAVSHELKTPLTAIRMHAEMLDLKMVPSEEKREEYYQTIHAEAQRLSRLIDNVLTLSRLEKNDCSLSLTIGDVRPVLQEGLDILASHAQQCEFTLHLEAEADLPPVRYERDALLQIIINCIDNAIKFSNEAVDKRVVLSLKRKGNGVQLRIRDFGPGIPKQYHKQVFESFYRGENELTRRTKGTGIGLALVRKLAVAMGIDVQAENCGDGGFSLIFQFQAHRG